MRSLVLVISLVAICHGLVRAEVPPVGISAPESIAWTGERVRILVELRANGSFSGSAGFDVPEIPGTLLIKVGNPVVSSREIEGKSWFVQTHEFALFSQKTGTVTIPPFPVRFGSRDGFTGPVTETVVKTEALSVEIQRPPGSEAIPFLVSTEELTVDETWEPVPGSATVGDVFRRTIVQRAEGLTGMALLPVPAVAPDGVRVYEPQVETSDNTERGAFTGERRETLTYLLQQDGSVTLPELTYTWWNPKSESLQSKTLPSVTIQVAPAPSVSEPVAANRGWLTWLVAIALMLLLISQRGVITPLLRKIRRILDPPERVAARHLLRACRRNDPAASQKAWNQWSLEAGQDLDPDLELRDAVLAMNRALFGPVSEEAWDGSAMICAFKKACHARRSLPGRSTQSKLPPLNSPNT